VGVQIIELNLSDSIIPCNCSGTCDLAAVDGVVKAVRAAVRAPPAVKLPALPGGLVGQAIDLLQRHRTDVCVCNTPQLAAFASAIGALDLVAVGGVSNGKGAQGALRRGAKAVQIGSALVKEGPAVFARLQRELSAADTVYEAGAR
jgi:dihydroorotate dehydrogenase